MGTATPGTSGLRRVSDHQRRHRLTRRLHTGGSRQNQAIPPYTLSYVRYIPTPDPDWAQPPIGLSSRLKDYVGVCLSVCPSRLTLWLHQIADAELHLTYFGGKEYIYLRPPTTYDSLRYDGLRRVDIVASTRSPEQTVPPIPHPHYHTNSGTRLGAAPDRLVK